MELLEQFRPLAGLVNDAITQYMPISPIIVRRLAHQLKWSEDDSRACLESVTQEAEGMSPEGAATVIYIINRSIVEMTPGMASVVILSAANHLGVAA